MSTIAVQSQSYSSPLRPRDSDPALRNPRAAAALRNNASTEMRRSMSSGASARAAGNNASRSPSGERMGRNAQHVPTSHGGSKSPAANGQPTYAPKPPAPSSNPNSSPNVPLIKKELPSSPESTAHPNHNAPASLPASRHRPRKLDLSRNSNKSVPPGASTVGARPSTKDSAGLGVMHDMGLACLSPGFQSQDPGIQAALQKSMDIREHQRRIIESQMHGKSSVVPEGEKGAAGGAPSSSAFSKPPGSSRRKGPPPGLAIHAPNAQSFAHEPRVIQSAPLNQTFTGLNQKHPSSLSRQVLDRPTQPSHIGPQFATQGTPSQSAHRLPPISDVLDSARGPPSGFHAPHSTYSPAHPAASMASPGYPPPPASAGLQPPRSHPVSQSQHPPSREGYPVPPRQREFKSAEEAVQTLSGGREDLQPRVVHYGGHQPPTPPSPRQHGDQKPPPTSQPQYEPRSGSGRRRTREEYERDLAEADRMDVDPRERDRDWERRRAAAMNDERRYAAWEEEQQQRGRRAMPATGPFGHRIDSPETNRRKKEEFMGLCARAWDLLHS